MILLHYSVMLLVFYEPVPNSSFTLDLHIIMTVDIKGVPDIR